MEHDPRTFAERRALSCSEVEELLDSYIDGDMSPGTSGRFEVHLEQCEYCRSVVLDCKHIVALAKTLAETPVPPMIRHRLREALRERVGHISENQHSRLTLIKT